MRILLLLLVILHFITTVDAYTQTRTFRNIQQGEQICSGTCTCTPLVTVDCQLDCASSTDVVCNRTITLPGTVCDINLLRCNHTDFNYGQCTSGSPNGEGQCIAQRETPLGQEILCCGSLTFLIDEIGAGCTLTPIPSPSPSPSPTPSISPSPSPTPGVCEYPFITCPRECEGVPETLCCANQIFCGLAQTYCGVAGCVPLRSVLTKERSFFDYLFSLIIEDSGDDDGEIPHPVLQKSVYASTPSSHPMEEQYTLIGVEKSKYVMEQLIQQDAIDLNLQCTCEFECTVPDICVCDVVNATTLIVTDMATLCNIETLDPNCTANFSNTQVDNFYTNEIHCTGDSLGIDCSNLNLTGVNVTFEPSSIVDALCEEGVIDCGIAFLTAFVEELWVTQIGCFETSSIDLTCGLNLNDVTFQEGTTLNISNTQLIGLEPSTVVDALCEAGEIDCDLTVNGNITADALIAESLTIGGVQVLPFTFVFLQVDDTIDFTPSATAILTVECPAGFIPIFPGCYAGDSITVRPIALAGQQILSGGTTLQCRFFNPSETSSVTGVRLVAETTCIELPV